MKRSCLISTLFAMVILLSGPTLSAQRYRGSAHTNINHSANINRNTNINVNRNVNVNVNNYYHGGGYYYGGGCSHPVAVAAPVAATAGGTGAGVGGAMHSLPA